MSRIVVVNGKLLHVPIGLHLPFTHALRLLLLLLIIIIVILLLILLLLYYIIVSYVDSSSFQSIRTNKTKMKKRRKSLYYTLYIIRIIISLTVF